MNKTPLNEENKELEAVIPETEEKKETEVTENTAKGKKKRPAKGKKFASKKSKIPENETEEERKERENRISILRGIALRIPLLIYGAKVDDEEIGITINNLTERIDDASWEEFMPRGITKEIFEEIKPCFNAKMFALAGKRYRQLAREADSMHTDERVKRIAEIFSYFHNIPLKLIVSKYYKFSKR